jgi:hypothetical protein
MDVGTEVESIMPWDLEKINDPNSYLFRLIPASKRVGKRPRMYPSEACFILRDYMNEDSLSFNWDKYANSETNFILRGISYSESGGWIDCSSNVLFKFKIGFISSLKKFEKFEHSPDWLGNPSPTGKPNNRSHISLFCGTFDDGTRAELSDYSINNFDETHCPINLKDVREEIDRLRECANDTPFHKDWDFTEFKN